MNDSEILPPFGRLNDIEKGFSQKIAMAIAPKFAQNQNLKYSVFLLHSRLLALSCTCTLVLALGCVELVADVQRVRVLGGVEVLAQGLQVT